MFKDSTRAAYSLLLLACSVGAHLHAAERIATCVFKQTTATNFAGSCDLLDMRVSANLNQPKTGDRWIGTMQDRWPENPTDFEVVTGRGDSVGIAKTPRGWFPLQSFALSDDTLTVSFSTQKQVPPTLSDIRIISRALDILADESKWNRRDDRNCPPGADRWSVFCALLQATGEVIGSVHYRQPALQVAREVVNEVGRARITRHRLMDYNNHPDTTLADIHNLLRTAAGRIETQLRNRP